MGRDLLFTIGPERKEKPMKNQYSAGQARHKDPSHKNAQDDTAGAIPNPPCHIESS